MHKHPRSVNRYHHLRHRYAHRVRLLRLFYPE